MAAARGEAPAPSPGRGGLLEKLMAAVRPEFRAGVLVPDPGDPVLGYRLCAAGGCQRPASVRGVLCVGHGLRWKHRGRPGLPSFLADPGEPRGLSEPGRCTVPGCRYGNKGHGLCVRHHGRWERAGRPDATAWAAAAPAMVPGAGECGLPFCALWTENERDAFCYAHMRRWRQRHSSLTAEEFTAHCAGAGKPFIDLRDLPAQLRLEIQYAIQCRWDEKSVTAPPALLRLAVRQAADAGAQSLLALPEEQWRQRFTRGKKRGDGGAQSRSDSFLVFAREAVEILRDGSGWEAEYHRDIWRLARLPGLKRPDDIGTQTRSKLRFDLITQPWLRSLAKRWVRWRLVSGASVRTADSDVRALRAFSSFLTGVLPAASLAEIDRPLLERYLAWLSQQAGSPRTYEGRVGSLHSFFQAIRQHGWDDSLPTTAAFFAGDIPGGNRGQKTRHLAEYVMAQVEQPSSLDRWTHPEGRLVTIILIRCGLRISSAVSIASDCLLHDGQGAPYLRYFNTKMEREAAVPIDEELEAEIRAQQRRVLERWPGGNPNLFPKMTRNASGSRHLSGDAYRSMLNDWLDRCDIRDELGQPVHLTPHQWRHTFATRLINRDVPQEVIRVLLDHDSTQMTAHYAKITDQTVRRRWEQATKVNIRGERVTIDPDGPLAQAQWAKTRYGMATQTLANGYCGLPVQKACPHANSCLTCPVFITGPEFLPELREQRQRTLTLIAVSAGKGQDRVVEMNSQVLANLDRMIGEIQEDERPQDPDAG